MFLIEVKVVGDVILARRQLFLDDRMPTALNIDHIRLVDMWTDVFIGLGYLSEREQTIQSANQVGIHLDGWNIFAKRQDQLVEKAGFERENLLFGAQDFLLIFFQLFGDVTLGVHEGLFTDPIGRHFVLMGVTDLNIIAEDVVEGDLQAGNAGPLAFPLLYL